MNFQAVEEFKKGKVEYRVDKTGIVHIPFGKLNFEEEDLLINFLATVVRSFSLYHGNYDVFYLILYNFRP